MEQSLAPVLCSSPFPLVDLIPHPHYPSVTTAELQSFPERSIYQGAAWLTFTPVHTTHLWFRASTSRLDFCLRCLVILINNLGLATWCPNWLIVWEAPQLHFKFTRGKANLLGSIKLSHYRPHARQRTQASTGRTAKGLREKGPSKCRTKGKIPCRGFNGGHVKKTANDSGFGGHTRFEWAEGEGGFWQVGSYGDKFTAGNMRSILGRLSQVTSLPWWFSNSKSPRRLVRTHVAEFHTSPPFLME